MASAKTGSIFPHCQGHDRLSIEHRAVSPGHRSPSGIGPGSAVAYGFDAVKQKLRDLSGWLKEYQLSADHSDGVAAQLYTIPHQFHTNSAAALRQLNGVHPGFSSAFMPEAGQ
jgi:hypothetical protein